MIKKLFFIFITLICFSLYSFADVKVSPTLIEMNTKNIKTDYLTTSFTVQAGNYETIRFKLYPQYFKISDDGKMLIEPKGNYEDSLVDNLHFVPSEFTLKNGRSQKVRLTITNLKKIQDGESRLVLFLEDVAAKEVDLPNSYKNVSTRLIVKTRVGIPVYLDKGNVTKKMKVENIDLTQEKDKLLCDLKLNSVGNSKIRYSLKTQVSKGKSLLGENRLNNNVIGANTSFKSKEFIPIDYIKENGKYKVKFIFSYKDENDKNKILVEEREFLYKNEI